MHITYTDYVTKFYPTSLHPRLTPYAEKLLSVWISTWHISYGPHILHSSNTWEKRVCSSAAQTSRNPVIRLGGYLCTISSYRLV